MGNKQSRPPPPPPPLPLPKITIPEFKIPGFLNNSPSPIKQAFDAPNLQEKLNDTINQLNITKDQLNNTKGQLNNTTDQLNNTTDQLNNTTDQLNNTTDQLNNTRGQLYNTTVLNDTLSSRIASLWETDQTQKKQITTLNTDLDISNRTVSSQKNVISEYKNDINEYKNEIEVNNGIIKDLGNAITGLTNTNEDLQKKNLLNKTIALIKENTVLINQITDNQENYSTDFQKIYYKQEQIMKLKSVNFYLLIVYYFFIIILIYYAFFNKNNFSMYFKVGWILFFAILPLLSFIIIDIKLQALKFLWSYIISMMYGHSFYTDN
jgi:small-conductance mechanosensitive channel